MFGFIIAMISLTSFAQNDVLFEQGKSFYKQDKYIEAIEQWKKILDKKVHSADLYFNLANAHYKLNNVAPSIYFYEKALRLSPNDSEIKNNLAFAQNMTIDIIEPLPKTVFAKWYNTVSGVMEFNGWAITSITFVVLFVLLFLAYYFSFSERKKRFLFLGFIIAFIGIIISLVFAFYTYSDFKNDRPAIIFSESIDVQNSPTKNGEVSFTLHEGTKVQVTNKEDNWFRIKLIDGKDGWIPEESLKEL